MIAYVDGHTHANRGRRSSAAESGFWQINTASHVDWPAAEPRMIELMDNRDGTLSLFGTMLDSARPVAAPAPGPPPRSPTPQLGSLARTLA